MTTGTIGKHVTRASALKPGDMLVLAYYTQVERIYVNDEGQDVAVVRDLDQPDNGVFEIRTQDLIGRCTTNNQYSVVQDLTQTDMGSKFAGLTRGALFQVHYDKKEGEPRTLSGRYLWKDGDMGRSHVEDLELPMDDKRQRRAQVDHRTIHWLILDGVKYQVKGWKD